MSTQDAIGYEAARPALVRIAELEAAVVRQAREITRLRLLLTIVEPDDILVRLPDGGEIQAEEHIWAEAIHVLVSKYGGEFRDILDEIGMVYFGRGGV